MIQKSSLKYTGTLYLEADGKEVRSYNHGSINLFKLIASVLCREEYTSRKLPTYIMLYQDSIESLIKNPTVSMHTNSELLSRYIDIVSYSLESNDNIDSNFTSTIYTSMLLSTAILPSVVALALIGADKTEILAAVEFDLNVYDIIRSGRQAQLKWVLTISNS